MQHQPNPTATVYSLRYLRLLDLLRDERATEPRLRTEDPVEWLAWAHAVRWLIVSPLRLLVMFVLKLVLNFPYSVLGLYLILSDNPDMDLCSAM